MRKWAEARGMERERRERVVRLDNIEWYDYAVDLSRERGRGWPIASDINVRDTTQLECKKKGPDNEKYP